ncbi:AAA family ATPase [Dyella kyungheensis]|uniref:AAA family ATPase n=1 Tax=Dyella kyungheensis TaxID=1242174 RepID=UPI003CEC4D17
MAKVHLVEGPVGAGKSTFVAKLSKEHAAPSLILDAWFVRLYSPDHPVEGLMHWYAERKERCLSQIWATSLDILGAGHDVILELGLVERASRERFYALVESAGYELTIYLLDAPRDVRRERVRQRNREKGPTYAMEVPDVFFELASDHWEPVNETERERFGVRVIA